MFSGGKPAGKWYDVAACNMSTKSMRCPINALVPY